MLQRFMTIDFSTSTTLSDPELLAEVRCLAGHERHATARLIAALGELDARRLYLGEGCSSLFTYCTQVLHLSEHAAYGRIEAARAARKWPAILDLLADGSVHLTAIGLLAPHLTGENHQRRPRRRAPQDQARSRRDRGQVAATAAHSIVGAQAARTESSRCRPGAAASCAHLLRALRTRPPRLNPQLRRRPRVRRSSPSRPNGTKCSSPCRVGRI